MRHATRRSEACGHPTTTRFFDSKGHLGSHKQSQSSHSQTKETSAELIKASQDAHPSMQGLHTHPAAQPSALTATTDHRLLLPAVLSRHGQPATCTHHSAHACIGEKSSHCTAKQGLSCCRACRCQPPHHPKVAHTTRDDLLHNPARAQEAARGESRPDLLSAKTLAVEPSKPEPVKGQTVCREMQVDTTRACPKYAPQQ